MSAEPTLRDVLNAVQDQSLVLKDLQVYAQRTEQRLDVIDQQMKEVFEILEVMSQHIDARADEITEQMATKVDLQRFATKEYLDDKLAALREGLVTLARQGNQKFGVLVEWLVAEKRMHPMVAQKILALEPFPQK